MIRQRLTVALACGGIPVGMAGGVLLGRDLPDVLVVGAALAVLAVWTLTAGYVGALIERRNQDDRFDKELEIALELREHAEQVRLAEALVAERRRFQAGLAADRDALIEATKEDPR